MNGSSRETVAGAMPCTSDLDGEGPDEHGGHRGRAVAHDETDAEAEDRCERGEHERPGDTRGRTGHVAGVHAAGEAADESTDDAERAHGETRALRR